MYRKAKFCLMLVSLNSLVDATSPKTNISGFNCESDGVCFQSGYNKMRAPQRELMVILYPPRSVILRKVDVFESTITLDSFKAKIQWTDRRIRLNSNAQTLSVGEKYSAKIWIPPIVNRNRKSGTTTQIPTTPTTGKISFA